MKGKKIGKVRGLWAAEGLYQYSIEAELYASAELDVPMLIGNSLPGSQWDHQRAIRKAPICGSL